MKDVLKGVVFIGIFLVPFIPLIVADSMFFPYITGKNFTFRIIVEIIFGAWVLLALLDKSYRPRFSWMLAGASALIIVMFFADLLGQYPLRSFWSNFERMDGYVTLVHFYLFFVVLAATLRDNAKLWTYFLWTTVAAAGYVAFDGLQQQLGGKFRVDSTLGNAAYMAVYMLFHAFFAIYLFVTSRNWWSRGILTLLFTLFVGILILTATRGTFLGLVTGLGVIVVYMALFAREYPLLRKIAIGGLAVLALSLGSFYAVKDSPFIQEDPILSRLANISLQEDLAVRMDVWGMAIEGVKERPILGWGQGNFNYVFNKYYNPDLYRAESWYDRAHNIVLDWLIAGGIVGFVAYMSILVALVFYLFWRPMFATEESSTVFSVEERAVLLGLLAAYFVHNLVVFDNIVSYIFFAVTLALIHARVSTPIESVETFEIDGRIVSNIAAPVVVVLVGSVVYFVNLPGIGAASDIIDALIADTIPKRLAAMERAVDRDSFAYQEVVEQFAQQAMQLSPNPNIPAEAKKGFIDGAEAELLRLEEEKPNDARVQVFISGFYRNIGKVEKAKVHIERARALSPTKQAIILEQGIIAYSMRDNQAMYDYFKEAYELQPEYQLARTFYATSLMYVGRADEVESIITPEYFDFFASNDFAAQAAHQFGQNALLARMYESRIAARPAESQLRASLAFLYYQAGDNESAIETLQAGVEEIPEFAELGTCYIENIQAGLHPSEGCE